MDKRSEPPGYTCYPGAGCVQADCATNARCWLPGKPALPIGVGYLGEYLTPEQMRNLGLDEAGVQG